MMQKIVYMEWVKLKARARYELGASSVSPVPLHELPEARKVVAIHDFNLYGYRPLVHGIAQRYGVEPQQVVTTQGASMANYLAYAAVLGAGDEVLIEKPAYEPLLAIAELIGARVRRFARPFRNKFQVDMEDLSAKLNRKTRLIVLTNLHNPSGVLLGEDELRKIGRLARRVGAYVVVDEVYLDFLFENRPLSAVHLGENFLVTSSLTKAYGFDGLRCGWVLANRKMAQEIWRLQDFFGVNGAIPAETISTAVFENIDRFMERSRRAVEPNRALVDAFMKRHAAELHWVAPDGGPVCFPKLKAAIDGSQFAERLYREYSTRVIPGRFFEMPRHFRLGFGGDRDALRRGLENAGKLLARDA